MAKTITVSDEQADLLISLINNDNLLDDGYSHAQITQLREVKTMLSNN